MWDTACVLRLTRLTIIEVGAMCENIYLKEKAKIAV